MIRNLRCLDETVHPEHEFTVTLIHPCSGPVECGSEDVRENHEPHPIVHKFDAVCSGVLTSLN